jgi:energy-coupling factor transporter ATP-binding protein EcfA2
METLSARALVGQLADDLTWLEQHCRQQPGQARAAGQLRLAAALVRNCIGPFLDGQPPTPLHVVVVGGAGAGKSTVANLLSGAHEAESNPQAGFTRHPIAYTHTDGPAHWAGHLGFLGPLQRLTEPAPSSIDEDVYQVRRVPVDPSLFDLLKDCVVWDCPDMTTWAAGGGERGGYISRLIEASALADVIVYVASDERYNDEVPTQFLHLLLQAGKPAVCCLMKMHEADVPSLLDHFQKEVIAHLPGGVVGTVAIPFLTPEQIADPAHQVPRFRIPLVNQVAVLTSPPEAARQRSVVGAMRFLTTQQEHLLSVARQDLTALQGWQALVERGKAEFNRRYQQEYLTSEKFRGFDEALVKLIELLELPGVGKVLSGALYVLRTPYRLLKGLVTKAMSRPEAPGRPELPILQEALAGWLDLLRRESARRAGQHGLWKHVAGGFHSGALGDAAGEQFQEHFRKFQAGLTLEVDRTARSLYEELAKRPGVLNTLRGSKFALDVAAVAAGIVVMGYGWNDIILVPLFASLTHQLVELVGKQVVEVHRERTRERQQALMEQHLSNPLAVWLTEWPATGGSSFERLQQALRRIPGSIQDLDGRVLGTIKS